MSTFSLTTAFVVPTSNVLPTTGSTQNLSAKQFGVYLPNYVPATAGTIPSAAYFYLAQGRTIYAPGEGSKRSDRIYPNLVSQWYKVTGQATSTVQITHITNLTAGCNEDITLTLRLFSFYINTAYHNGLTKSVMTTTPCCNCGSNPCDTLTANQIADVIDTLVSKINADSILSTFITASATGTPHDTIVLTGQALDAYGLPCDITAFPYLFDRMYFYAFLMNGPELTTDYEITDACNPVGTVTVTQRSGIAKLVSDEVAQIEKNFYPYQAEFKHEFSTPGFNGEFDSYVESGVTYDQYYIRFAEPVDPAYGNQVPQSEAVIILVPTGEGISEGLEAILVAALGNYVDMTATEPASTMGVSPLVP